MQIWKQEVYSRKVFRCSSDQTLAIFNTNFFGSLSVSNVFLPHFRARRSGTIINISSMMPYITTPGSGPYTATKAALDSECCTRFSPASTLYAYRTAISGVTKVWAGELAPFKIRVMGVSLGFTRTELLGSNLNTVENTVKNPVSHYSTSFGYIFTINQDLHRFLTTPSCANYTSKFVLCMAMSPTMSKKLQNASSMSC